MDDIIARYAVGEGLAPPEIKVKLKPCGGIAKEKLQLRITSLCLNILCGYIFCMEKRGCLIKIAPRQKKGMQNTERY